MLRVVHLLLFVSNLALLTAEKTYYDLADAENHFSDFIRKYEKLYEIEEDYNRRFEIFKDNLLHINDLNDIYDATYGVNAFADLTREEFEASHLGFVPSLDANTNEKVPVKKEWLEDAPDSLDYRDQGLVTEVKDQQDCGSCYVFSAIGNIEGQYAKKHKELISLSEQQGLDCDSVDNGCYGGTMLHVMQGLIKTGGSESEQDYPYHAAQINCRTDPSKIKVKVLSAKALDTATEEHLQAALLNYGPLAISLDMPDMQYYQEGVVTPMNCANPPDHAVVLVGYGKEEITSGREYWIIKNSWGTSWGEDGYFRLEKGKGYCLIGKYFTATAEVE